MWFGNTPNIEYTHRVHPRARRIKLTISRTGQVIVTSPRFTPKLLISQFVTQHQEWIAKTKAKLEATTQKLDHTAVVLFGKTYPVTVTFSAQKPLGISLEEGQALFNAAQDPSKPANQAAISKSIRKHAERLYKRTMSEYLQLRLPILAAQMRTTYTAISLREQKTRWGSCSSRGALSFNWRLVHHPPAVIEYVLIHELAHRHEMNHSRAFWDIVRQHCPEYPKHRGWLKRTQIAED